MSKDTEDVDEEQINNVAGNWAQAFSDNPEQTKEVVRGKLRQSKAHVKLVEKALSNRATRFLLDRKGALSQVEDEVERAKEYHGMD